LRMATESLPAQEAEKLVDTEGCAKLDSSLECLRKNSLRRDPY